MSSVSFGKLSFLLYLFLVGLALPGLSQINLARYFNQGELPLLNRSTPLKVSFKWDMDGRSQAILNEGLNNLEEGNIPIALSNFDSFINANYKLWVGHYYRGQALMRMSRFKEAEIEFTAVTKLNPSLAEGYLELGEAYEYQRNFSMANTLFQKAAEVDSKFVYAYFKMGNLALSSRDTEDAIKFYKKCNKVNPKFPDAYMALGIISWMKEKNHQKAISFFNGSLQADSTFIQTFFWRGLTYLDQNKKEECISDWNRFIVRNPRNVFVKTMRGFLNAELGNFEEAFSDFRKVLQTTDVSEDKFQGTQTPLDKRIDLQFAANYLIKKGYGLDEEVFYNLKAGFCLLLMDQDKKAFEYLKKAERMSSSPATYFLIAVGYEHAGIHNAAFQYYNRTLEYDNDIFDAHKKRSIYLSELKEWKAAYKDINEMLRIQPQAPVAFKLRGLMESSQSRYPEAIDDLTLFINSDSSDIEVLRTRALCYSLNNQPSKATQDLKRLFYLSEKNEQFYDKLYGDFSYVKDTVNTLYILKDYYSKFGTINSQIEIAKILIAQKNYDDAMVEINTAKASVKKQEEYGAQTVVVNNAGTFFGKMDFTQIKSLLSQLEAFIAFKKSLYEEAIKLFTKSLKENPNNFESMYLRGKCFIQQNNKPKALDDFKKLKEEKYKDAEQLYEELLKK